MKRETKHAIRLACMSSFGKYLSNHFVDLVERAFVLLSTDGEVTKKIRLELRKKSANASKR